MTSQFFNNPSLTLAISLFLGVVIQLFSNIIRMPSIVLLLLAGFVFGPEMIGIVRPEGLSGALETLVSFAVAVILFEGGMNLNLRRIGRSTTSIRNLITIGAATSMIGGFISAKLFLGWSWSLSLLFGSLVIVTGPTVIGPLLKKLHISPNISTILEAEGVFIDAVGAIISIITLEIVISPSGKALGIGLWHFFSKIGFGLIFGGAGGLFIGYIISRKFIPLIYHNLLTLTYALVLFQLSNAILLESGIVTVITAGFIFGNYGPHLSYIEEVKEFKEQLTQLLLGMLFILLAAGVKVNELYELGIPGLMIVFVLSFICRPLGVFLSTKKGHLKFKEKIFISWISPRGIVAAAISTLFARKLEKHGIAGGEQLQALVFLVIATTVVYQGFTSGLVAKLCGVRRISNDGHVILGATPLGLLLGKILKNFQHQVVIIESDPKKVEWAEDEGFSTYFGAPLDKRILTQARLEERFGVLAISQVEELNILFFKEVEKVNLREKYIYLKNTNGPNSLKDHLLFGIPFDYDLWNNRIKNSLADVYNFTCMDTKKASLLNEIFINENKQQGFLPLYLVSKNMERIYHPSLKIEDNQQLYVLINSETKEENITWLENMGYKLTGNVLLELNQI